MGKVKRQIKQYYQNYFSGSQCRLYFTTDVSGEHVDGFAFIEYSINSNKSPIYGYNDAYFRAISQGNYLVQGRMGFNLTSKERLNRIFNASLPSNRRQDFKDTRIVRPSRQAQTILNGSPVDNADSKLLQEIIEQYKAFYWGNDEGIKRRRFDQMDMLDNGDIDSVGFNIILLFGYPLGSYSQYYMKQINNVHILGESMQVTDDGRNVILTFDYFAKSVDDDETRYDDQSLQKPKLDGADSSKSPNSTDDGIATQRIMSDDYIRGLHISGGAGRNYNVEQSTTTDDVNILKQLTYKGKTSYYEQVIGCKKFTTSYTTTFPVKEKSIRITLSCPNKNININDVYMSQRYGYINITNKIIGMKNNFSTITFDLIIDRDDPYVSDVIVNTIESKLEVRLTDTFGNIIGITKNIIAQ